MSYDTVLATIKKTGKAVNSGGRGETRKLSQTPRTLRRLWGAVGVGPTIIKAGKKQEQRGRDGQGRRSGSPLLARASLMGEQHSDRAAEPGAGTQNLAHSPTQTPVCYVVWNARMHESAAGNSLVYTILLDIA